MMLYGLNPDQMLPTAQALRRKGKDAQSPNANWVAGYMGKSDGFEKAIVK